MTLFAALAACAPKAPPPPPAPPPEVQPAAPTTTVRPGAGFLGEDCATDDWRGTWEGTTLRGWAHIPVAVDVGEDLPGWTVSTPSDGTAVLRAPDNQGAIALLAGPLCKTLKTREAQDRLLSELLGQADPTSQGTWSETLSSTPATLLLRGETPDGPWQATWSKVAKTDTTQLAIVSACPTHDRDHPCVRALHLVYEAWMAPIDALANE